MRVLHILNELQPSGAEVMLVVAAPQWLARGYELHVLSTGAAPGILGGRFAEAGFVVHHIPFEKSVAFFASLRKLTVSIEPDVVHIHTERANLPYALVSRAARVGRTVRTIHSTFEFRGRLRLRRTVERFVLRRLKVIQVSIGNSVAETEFRVFRNRTKLIPNWYDTSHFRPPTQGERVEARADLGIAESATVVASIGNCAEVKNHHLLLRSLALLGELELVYLHVGAEQTDRSERELAIELALDRRVDFLGYQQDPLPYLWAADVFVMPSRHEGFSIAALEAIATGLPAVLTNVRGLTDLEGLTPVVRLCEPDERSLAMSIVAASNDAVTTDHAQRVQFSRRVAERFGVERAVRAYDAAYR